MMQRSSVVFPAPLGPRIATVWPDAAQKEISFKIWRSHFG